VPRPLRSKERGARTTRERRYDLHRLLKSHKIGAIITACVRPHDHASREEQPHRSTTASKLHARGLRNEVALEQAQRVVRKSRRVDESGSIEGVPCGRCMFEGEVERGREIAVGLYGESSQQSHIFHVDLGGEDASHRGGANRWIWVRQKMLEVYPGPGSWMSTEAAPEEARKGQKSPGAESKLAVDAVGDGGGDSCVNAGGVERGAVYPPIANPRSFQKASSEKTVLWSGSQSIRKIPVGAGCRNKPTEASPINGTLNLFDRLGLRKSQRRERRVRVNDTGETNGCGVGELSRTAPTHLLNTFEPRLAEADCLDPRGGLVAVELAPVTDVPVGSVVRKTRDGATAPESSAAAREGRCRASWRCTATGPFCRGV
jgi:hypothetical protein